MPPPEEKCFVFLKLIPHNHICSPDSGGLQNHLSILFNDIFWYVAIWQVFPDIGSYFCFFCVINFVVVVVVVVDYEEDDDSWWHAQVGWS